MALFGRYTLRASPAIGIGGMYATGQNEVNAAVITAPQTPEFIERQSWEIRLVDGKEDTYTIFLWTNGSRFGGSFSTKEIEPVPEDPIITSQRVQEWIIQPIDSEARDAYRISLPTRLVGVDFVAGTEDRDVVLRAFPVVPGVEIPYWVIRRFEE